MKSQISATNQKDQQKEFNIQGDRADTVYALGLIGAWVYYIGRATTFQEGVVGFLKGLVWPAYLVYNLFKFLDKER